MASANRERIIFFTVLGTFLMPLMFLFVFHILDSILRIIQPDVYPIYLVNNDVYFHIVKFWEIIFPIETVSPKYGCKGCHSDAALSLTSLTYLVFFAVTSYLLSKQFIKEKSEDLPKIY